MDECRGDHSIFNNELIVINVLKKNIKCLDALFNPRLNVAPLCRSDDTGMISKGKIFSIPSPSL